MEFKLKKKFVILNEDIRQRCINFLYELPFDTVPDGWKVVITPNVPDKTRDQEEKYHAQIGDIKKSGRFAFMGRTDWHQEDIKRLLIDAYSRIRTAEGRPLRYVTKVVPSLDGSGVVHLNPRSRDFSREEASEFIEFLYAYGTDLGVRWSEPKEEQP
jgi:hypothetical protein